MLDQEVLEIPIFQLLLTQLVLLMVIELQHLTLQLHLQQYQEKAISVIQQVVLLK